MFSVIARLKQRSDFLRVARAQRKWVTPGLILQARPHGDAEENMNNVASTEAFGEQDSAIRVGFTVSRKVGGAVQRNRAKRRLRAVVNKVLAGSAMPGHDYVIIGRQQTLTRPFGVLVEDLIKALQKLGVYKSIKNNEQTC